MSILHWGYLFKSSWRENSTTICRNLFSKIYMEHIWQKADKIWIHYVSIYQLTLNLIITCPWTCSLIFIRSPNQIILLSGIHSQLFFFPRHMEMSPVWIHWNANISIFSWQLESPHNKPWRRQQNKRRRHAQRRAYTDTNTRFGIINSVLDMKYLKELDCKAQMVYSLCAVCRTDQRFYSGSYTSVYR